jgi:hypothetical protein
MTNHGVKVKTAPHLNAKVTSSGQRSTSSSKLEIYLKAIIPWQTYATFEPKVAGIVFLRKYI